MKTLTVEMIESLCGPASPRPWSIIAGESGEGVIGDADGLDIAAASMADCVVIVRAVNEVDTLRSDLARVTAERDAAREVCDARKAETDALRAEVEAMRGAGEKLAGLLKNMHVGHGAFPRSGCGVCQPIDATLDALRTRKVGG